MPHTPTVEYILVPGMYFTWTLMSPHTNSLVKAVQVTVHENIFCLIWAKNISLPWKIEVLSNLKTCPQGT